MLNIYLRQYFAVQVSLKTFWDITGYQVTCRNSPDHPVSETALFCETCGTPTLKIPHTKATSTFQTFCEQQESTPEETFKLLTEERWEWSDEELYDGPLRLGLHAIQAVVRADQKDTDQKWGLGVKFGFVKVSDPTRRPGFVSGVPYNTLVAAEKAVREISEVFGLTEEPHFYSQVEFQV